MENKEIIKKLKYYIDLLENGYLTTPAVGIKRLALELDKEGLGTPIATIKKEMGNSV